MTFVFTFHESPIGSGDGFVLKSTLPHSGLVHVVFYFTGVNPVFAYSTVPRKSRFRQRFRQRHRFVLNHEESVGFANHFVSIITSNGSVSQPVSF